MPLDVFGATGARSTTPEDERFLVDRDEHADHYQLVWSAGWDRL